MPNVTGNLTDVGFDYLAGLNPVVEFHLNAPQVSANRVYATRPAKVTPASNGDFTVSLADTTAMHADAFYTMHVRWQEPGSANVQGFSPVDVHIDTPIRVPSTGGSIGDLIGSVTNLSLVYISLIAPKYPLPLMLWYKTDPDDPTNSNGKNTGNIYRRENF